MPALFTHYKFGQDVLKNLNKKEQDKINENIKYYNMANQAFDNLYYNIFHWNYYRTFGVKAHKKNIGEFFHNFISYIKENNLENDSEITNMVYGFLNHYTLDTILHPLINYETKHLHTEHVKIEYTLDFYNYYLEYNSKWKSNIYNTLIPRLKFSKDLKKLLDDVFYTTHKEKNIGKIFNKSHNLGYYIHRYFIYDYYGIKTFFYKIVDKLIPNKDVIFSKNTFYIKNVDLLFLNQNHEQWTNPQNKAEVYNYSLDELYNYALNIGIKLNTLAFKVINNKTDDKELIKLIKKVSLKNIPELLQK